MRAISKHHALRMIGAFYLYFACLPAAVAQPRCIVEEERRIHSQSASFSIGGLRARLTMPTTILQGYFPTLFLEVTGDSSVSRELFLECCGTRVSLKHGASLRPAPKPGERIQFTVSTGNGESLCTWQPSFFGWKRHDPPNLEAGILGSNSWIFRNVGDPIVLAAGGDLSRSFLIDGQPAMVLSRTSWQAILRDPQPAAGSRVVESDGHSITLRFIEVVKHWSPRDSRGRTNLEIRVPKLELWGRHYWQPLKPQNTMPLMNLINLGPDSIRLLCGETVEHPLGADRDQGKSIRITAEKIRNGTLKVNCPVQAPAGMQPNIDVWIFESPPRPTAIRPSPGDLLRLPRPLGRFIERERLTPR